MYEHCRELLDHVVRAYSRTPDPKLLKPVEHLAACASRGDCPERGGCRRTVGAFRDKALAGAKAS